MSSLHALRADFRCIAVDYPGFGPSSAPPDWTPTVPGLSHVVERFIETLGLERVILVAGDAGGPIGLGVAARHPAWFAGLVLAGTFGWPLDDDPGVRRMLRLSGGPLVRLLQERFNLLLKVTARSFPMSAAERAVCLAPYATPAARRAAVVLLGDLAGNDAYMADIERALQTHLQHLPVLLLWGDKDLVYAFLPRFQRLFPRAQSVIIPGAHHFPFADAPQPMITAIRRWWQAASTSTPPVRRVS